MLKIEEPCESSLSERKPKESKMIGLYLLKKIKFFPGLQQYFNCLKICHKLNLIFVLTKKYLYIISPGEIMKGKTGVIHVISSSSIGENLLWTNPLLFEKRKNLIFQALHGKMRANNLDFPDHLITKFDGTEKTINYKSFKFKHIKKKVFLIALLLESNQLALQRISFSSLPHPISSKEVDLERNTLYLNDFFHCSSQEMQGQFYKLKEKEQVNDLNSLNIKENLMKSCLADILNNSKFYPLLYSFTFTQKLFYDELHQFTILVLLFDVGIFIYEINLRSSKNYALSELCKLRWGLEITLPTVSITKAKIRKNTEENYLMDLVMGTNDGRMFSMTYKFKINHCAEEEKNEIQEKGLRKTEANFKNHMESSCSEGSISDQDYEIEMPNEESLNRIETPSFYLTFEIMKIKQINLHSESNNFWREPITWMTFHSEEAKTPAASNSICVECTKGLEVLICNLDSGEVRIKNLNKTGAEKEGQMNIDLITEGIKTFRNNMLYLTMNAKIIKVPQIHDAEVLTQQLELIKSGNGICESVNQLFYYICGETANVEIINARILPSQSVHKKLNKKNKIAIQILLPLHSSTNLHQIAFRLLHNLNKREACDDIICIQDLEFLIRRKILNFQIIVMHFISLHKRLSRHAKALFSPQKQEELEDDEEITDPEFIELKEKYLKEGINLADSNMKGVILKIIYHLFNLQYKKNKISKEWEAILIALKHSLHKRFIQKQLSHLKQAQSQASLSKSTLLTNTNKIYILSKHLYLFEKSTRSAHICSSISLSLKDLLFNLIRECQTKQLFSDGKEQEQEQEKEEEEKKAEEPPEAIIQQYSDLINQCPVCFIPISPIFMSTPQTFFNVLCECEFRPIEGGEIAIQDVFHALKWNSIVEFCELQNKDCFNPFSYSKQADALFLCQKKHCFQYLWDCLEVRDYSHPVYKCSVCKILQKDKNQNYSCFLCSASLKKIY